MLMLMIHKLKRHPFARITFPDGEKIEDFAQKINIHEHKVNDVIGFMDNLVLTTECSSEPVEQNSMYNGYHSDTMVNNIFVFGMDGTVYLCIYLTGSWHDGSITANILPYICKNISK
jgi:hypothetical protein